MQTKKHKLNDLQKGKNYFYGSTMYQCEKVNTTDQTAVFTVFICDNGEALQTGTKTLCESELIFEN